MANIKGFGIRGLFRYLKENKPGSAAAIIARLSPEAQQILTRPVVASNMYPYHVFSELLRAIDREVGHGDLRRCEDVGDFAARQDIGGMFKMMVSVLSPRTIVERSGVFWSKYCDTGTFKPIASDAKNSVMRLEGFPGMDAAHCSLMLGWIRRWALMTNAKSVRVEHSSCVSRGNPVCEWKGSWE